MRLISLIIVNWNSGNEITDSIRSAISSQEDKNIRELIVIDNSPAHDSLKWVEGLESEFKVLVVKNLENLGFAKACNQGASLASGQVLLFLNPDTSLLPGSLSEPLKKLTAPEGMDIGVIGVQLLDNEGAVARSCAYFPSPAAILGQALGLDRFIPGLFRPHFMLDWAHDTTRDVDQVIGAFFMVRRSVFDILGGFDERFFVYFEELDFSLRARQLGLRTVYLAEASAYHAGEVSSAQVKDRRLLYSLNSRLLYARKHFSPAGFLLTLLATALLEPVSRLLFFLGQRRFQDAYHTAKGFRLFYQNLPHLLKRRPD